MVRTSWTSSLLLAHDDYFSTMDATAQAIGAAADDSGPRSVACLTSDNSDTCSSNTFSSNNYCSSSTCSSDSSNTKYVTCSSSGGGDPLPPMVRGSSGGSSTPNEAPPGHKSLSKTVSRKDSFQRNSVNINLSLSCNNKQNSNNNIRSIATKSKRSSVNRQNTVRRTNHHNEDPFSPEHTCRGIQIGQYSPVNLPPRFTNATSSSRYTSIVRMLVLGAHGVGKSATVVRFLTQRFIGEYRSQVDIVYRHTLRQADHDQMLEIIDISTSQNGEPCGGDCWLPTAEVESADCILVVYSIADHESVLTAQRVLAGVDLITGPQRPPLTLLANKLDLDHCRQVPREEGEAIASKYKSAFAEVSAAESSEDIIPVFLHLIHRANEDVSSWSLRSRHQSCLVDRPDQTFLCGQDTLTPTSRRKFSRTSVADDKEEENSRTASPTPSSISFQRQKSLLSCSERIKSHFDRSNKNNLQKGNEGSMFSQRCRSYDEALNLCKMEIYPSNGAIDKSRITKSDNKLRSKYAASRKVSKPSQMPTGRSKSKKSKISSSPKYSEYKFLNSEMNRGQNNWSLSQMILPGNFSALEDEREPKRLRQHGEFLSKSVDQNLQTCVQSTLKIDKLTKVSKPFSFLKRGRSFIQEARDKHLKEKDKRLSFRNVESRSDISELYQSTIPRSSLGRARTLPTGGKTWLTRSEGDEESPRLLDRLTLSCSTSEKIDDSTFGSLDPRVSPIKNYEDDKLDCQKTTEEPVSSDRHRKFSVFSRTIGNFLSRGSMPDLPRATANLYDKFDSFKKSIKKRSV